MNIVLCADENYAMPCGICLTSIFENNRNVDLDVCILSKGMKDSTKWRFRDLAKTYHQNLKVVDIDASLFEGLKISERFTEAIYYRFLIPDIIDGDKALYLDCDIIVTGSLKGLWDTDISHVACAVVEDQTGDDIRHHNRIGMYSDYFNSGVMLMNLGYWKENHLKSLLVDYIYKNPERCLYPDQDALNVLLEGRVLFLDYTYNYQEKMMLPIEKSFLHRSKWELAHKYTKELPTIIHYTAVKPWYRECTHCYKEHFLYYKSISPWSTEKIRYMISRRERCVNASIRFIKELLFLYKR